MRKKVKFLLFVLFVFICFPNTSKAVLNVPDPVVNGKVIISWLDYEDKMGERPDSIDIELKDAMSDETITKTFKAEDAVVNTDPSMTTWTFDVELPKLNDYVTYVLGYPTEVEGYDLHYASGGQIDSDGGTINLVYVKHLSKYVTYTEHWDDGNQRDMPRFFAMWMRPTNNDLLLGTGVEEFPRSLECGLDNDSYIDENTCQLQIYIPYIYPFDDNGVPIWNTPTAFEYEIYDTIKNYDYDVKIDDDGNIDVYITHEPYKLDNSKVEVIWDDNDNKNGKRPDEINLDLYNLDVKEQTITVSNDTWDEVITNLYQNYSYMKKSEYSLNIENTGDYEFTVTGNNTDGFKVNAKYIGEEVTIDNGEDIKEDNVKNENIIDEEVNPKTNDSIVLYVVILALMTIVVITSVYFLKKKNSK